MRREVLLCFVLCACKPHERAVHDAAPKAVVQPANPDAVKRARDTFTLVPAIDRTGSCSLFLREHLVPMPAAADDIGDFVGRLRTLFGPVANNEYTLRDASGLVIIAAVNPSGPGYYGNTYDNRARRARIAADPLLAHGPPRDMGQMPAYVLHDEIASAGPALTERVFELDALVNSVPPADWQMTDYFSSKDGVFHLGAAHGRSFEEELPPTRSLHFLLDAADRDGAGSFIEFVALNYYARNPKPLSADRSRVLAAYRGYIAGRPGAAGTESDLFWRRALQLDHF
jgi:hypothetical protein